MRKMHITVCLKKKEISLIDLSNSLLIWDHYYQVQPLSYVQIDGQWGRKINSCTTGWCNYLNFIRILVLIIGLNNFAQQIYSNAAQELKCYRVP